MFWRNARKKYGHITSDDEDIQEFQKLSSEIQNEGYDGIVGFIQDLGHKSIAKRTPAGRALEIGFGAGRHRLFYTGDKNNHIVSEYSRNHIESDGWREFRGRGVCCDARALPFTSSSFKTVISIYNLEHISDLQDVFREVSRVLVPGGLFLIALPCEDGLLYNIGRELTTRRSVQNNYGLNYDKLIAYEHVWSFHGVCEQLNESSRFKIVKKTFLPMFLPTVHLNLVAVLTCIATDN